ncbi:hypothetical protein GCM10009678_76050 [Actinomadura kijaniata]|uniref:DUF2867 domain-containing protein n=1 Tax=Actinomadura namibiensis TaxID=182080 RepID=A0A7W3M0G9_ACTNM|nr:DUF2867 domain-containing protein [Actinomadura namibiensis]MBA8957593.1 hypothetical protein [Actinomadura namibiensis]
MRLPNGAHAARPWRIHEIADGFRVEDVWAIRTPGAGPDDFPAARAAALATMRPSGGPAKDPLPVRLLFAARRRLGALFGWDGPETGVGTRVRSLRDRLPDDLRAAPAGSAPFTPVYELDDECALERASATVHAVIHLGWAPVEGGHELRMAVLVKPAGLPGRLYMAAIAPFRRLVVFPALVRQCEQAWRDRDAAPVTGVVGTRDVPESVRALGALPDGDYVDHFTLPTDADATPEQWARAMFGDVPTPAERLIWSGLLGIRLSRGRSPDTVAGWRIAERGEGWIRLEAASWFLTDRLVVQAADGRVSLGTFLRYDRPLGRYVWPPLAAVHRRLAPGLLREAEEKIRARDE